MTPFSSTNKDFSSKTMSADSFATSTALSTDIPTSAALSAAASLMPSPKNPTTKPLFCKALTILSLWSGESLAKIVMSLAIFSNSSSLILSRSLPSITFCTSIPTSLQTFLVTAIASPVRILTLTPCFFSKEIACAVLSFGGSKNAINPIRVKPCSSATEYCILPPTASPIISFFATAITLKPSSLKLFARIVSLSLWALSKSIILPLIKAFELIFNISSTAPLQITKCCF